MSSMALGKGDTYYTYDTLVFTGPIDVYFKDSELPPLEYRSLKFEWSRVQTDGYLQPNSVIKLS